jgi:Ca-activated chloride channel family protein
MKKSIWMLLAAAGVLLTGCSTKNGAYLSDEGYYMGNGGDAVNPDQKGDQFEDFTDNPFVNTCEQPQSTFSVDADGASYAYMRRCLIGSSYATPPAPSSIRIEEFLNYFTFDYPDPAGNEAVAINGEIGACPWNKEHRLMRLGIKGRSVAEADMPAANFVFMVDVSGSMDSNDKIELLKSGLVELVTHMRADDRIAIVTYASHEELLLPSTPCSEAEAIIRKIKQLKASGSTAGSQALEMAYEQAKENYIQGGNNRIIIGTDGDWNVGVTSTDALLEIVQNHAKDGIYMSVCGFGRGNLNDIMMEKISNAGNGTYSYIDCEDEMMKVFCYERSNMLSVASDAKIQITFDSMVVAQYRLIGYENRVMRNEDFNDDSKDAGEIGAGQTITALYELVPRTTDGLPQGWDADAQAATFDFRYKQTLGEESIPLQLAINTWVGDASENLNFAAGVAAYGMLLRQSPHAGNADYAMAKELVEQNRSFDPHDYRAQPVTLISQAGQTSKK